MSGAAGTRKGASGRNTPGSGSGRDGTPCPPRARARVGLREWTRRGVPQTRTNKDTGPSKTAAQQNNAFRHKTEVRNGSAAASAPGPRSTAPHSPSPGPPSPRVDMSQDLMDIGAPAMDPQLAPAEAPPAPVAHPPAPTDQPVAPRASEGGPGDTPKKSRKPLVRAPLPRPRTRKP